MAEPRNFIDVLRELNIGPRARPSVYSGVTSAEEALRAQEFDQNRPEPTPLNFPDIGRAGLSAARMAQAAGPAVQQMAASPAPVPQTVEETLAKNQIKSLNAGSLAANKITEADRKADMAKTLMGGDMQAFMQNLLAQQNTAPPTQQNTAPPKDNFIGNLLRMFAQPEFQQAGFEGQGFGPTVLGATKALRAMDTQDAATNAAMLKADSERIAAEAKMAEATAEKFPKPSAEISGIYDAIDASQRRVDKVNSIKKILSAKIATGVAGSGLTKINQMAAALGFNLSPTGQQDINRGFAELKQLMIQARVFGRETSAKEQEIVDILLPNAGVFTSPDRVLSALSAEYERALLDAKNASSKLTLYGLPRREDILNRTQIGVASRRSE